MTSVFAPIPAFQRPRQHEARFPWSPGSAAELAMLADGYRLTVPGAIGPVVEDVVGRCPHAPVDAPAGWPCVRCEREHLAVAARPWFVWWMPAVRAAHHLAYAAEVRSWFACQVAVAARAALLTAVTEHTSASPAARAVLDWPVPTPEQMPADALAVWAQCWADDPTRRVGLSRGAAVRLGAPTVAEADDAVRFAEELSLIGSSDRLPPFPPETLPAVEGMVMGWGAVPSTLLRVSCQTGTDMQPRYRLLLDMLSVTAGRTQVLDVPRPVADALVTITSNDLVNVVVEATELPRTAPHRAETVALVQSWASRRRFARPLLPAGPRPRSTETFEELVRFAALVAASPANVAVVVDGLLDVFTGPLETLHRTALAIADP